jgi:hypothetical protein
MPGMSFRLLTVAFVALAFGSGCSTVVREVQRSEAHDAPNTILVLGQSLTLEHRLRIESIEGGKSGYITGQRIVAAAEGKLPTMQLHHFQLISEDWRRELVNYNKDSLGWYAMRRYASGPSRRFDMHISEREEAGKLILELELNDWKRSRSKYSLTVSLTDVTGKQYKLGTGMLMVE